MNSTVYLPAGDGAFIVGIKAPNQGAYGFKKWGRGSSFFPEDTLSVCLDSDQTAALIGVHHLCRQTLAHYHLDRLLTPPPPPPPSSNVLLFQCVCVSTPVDLPLPRPLSFRFQTLSERR